MKAGARVLTAGAAALSIAVLTVSQAVAGDGTFQPAPEPQVSVGATPAAIGIADFNQDGDPDLAVANRDSSDVNFLIGAPGAAFTPAAAPTPVPPATQAGGGPQSIGMGDFNGDGDPDFAVPNPTATPNSVSIFTGTAGPGFSLANISVLQRPTKVAVGDFNADGDQDLAITTTGNEMVTVLTGAAGSSFTAAGSESAGDGATALATADFNGDGDPDLATAGLFGNVTVLLGGPGATFTRQPAQLPAGTGPTAIAAGDFNGDGDPDLAVTNSGSDDVTVLAGAAGASFAPGTIVAAGDGPSAVAVSEFNGDGDPDLAVSNRAAGTAAGSVSVLLGGAGTAFAAAPGSPVTVGAEPLAAEVADFDADGNRDLITADGGADTVSALLGGPVPDRTAPETTIDKGPKPKTEKEKAKIAYSADEPASFECALKGSKRKLRAFTDCGDAKVKYKNLDPGKKKFQVRAIDAAGNVDQTPAKLKWKVLD